MDLIYKNSQHEDVGILHHFSCDYDVADTMDFQLDVGLKNNVLKGGYYWFIPGTEYGGKIDKLKVVTDNEKIEYYGRNIRGLLSSKIIIPPAGEDYKTVSGYVSDIVAGLIEDTGYHNLFTVDGETVEVQNFKFARYISVYDGIKALCRVCNYVPIFTFDVNGVCHITFTASIDYTDELEYSPDDLGFEIEKVYCNVNHLICLGTGELKDRTVVNLYVQEDGRIGQTQYYFGDDEVTEVYDYSNIESEEELIVEGKKKLNELYNADNFTVKVNETSIPLHVGDIVGGVERTTDTYVSAEITNVVANITEDSIQLEYKAGSDRSSSGSSASHRESNSAQLQLYDNVQIITTQVTNVYNTTVEMKQVIAVLNEDVDILKVTTIKAEQLNAKVAELGYLTADSAVIKDLTTETAKIDSLETNIANIQELMFGSAVGTSITTEFANSVVSIVDDAIIKSAMIESVSASKITSGALNTNNVTVKSTDGGFQLYDNTMQFKDKNNIVRVQIGKGSDNEYDMTLVDADGNVMWNASGLQEKGIKSGIIRDDMVSERANISASKLDIESLFSTINNDGTHTFNANKIYLDNERNTLSAAFTSLSSNVDSIQAQVDGTVKYYGDLEEEPTLSNYPANTFCEFAPLGDGVPLDGSRTIGIYTDSLYKKYLGTKAFMSDGTKSWIFSMRDNGSYYWREITGTIEAKLSARISALELSSEQLTSDFDAMDVKVNNYGTQISSMNSSIKQNAEDISLRVTKTVYDTGMEGKANKSTIISEINQSAENILISASKVNIKGAVTFESFSSELQSKVNGIDKKAGDADSLLSELTTIENDKTVIDGGKIKTESILAKHIAANSITAEKIASNAITADKIDVEDLFSKTIKASGTITGATLKGGSISIGNPDDESATDYFSVNEDGYVKAKRISAGSFGEISSGYLTANYYIKTTGSSGYVSTSKLELGTRTLTASTYTSGKILKGTASLSQFKDANGKTFYAFTSSTVFDSSHNYTYFN